LDWYVLRIQNNIVDIRGTKQIEVKDEPRTKIRQRSGLLRRAEACNIVNSKDWTCLGWFFDGRIPLVKMKV